MKKIALYTVLLLSFWQSAAQTISGSVIDNATNEPLPFANVFIDNTTIGTVATDNGSYTIKDLTPGRVTVAASFVGYRTLTQVVDLKVGTKVVVNFSLPPLEKQLSEVELISRQDKKWQRQLDRFKVAFVGTRYDIFAINTRILNPWVIDFDEGKADGGDRYFSATMSEPLQIENAALGYRLVYHLETFYQTSNSTTYQGPVQFIELDTTSKSVAKKWQENRQKAYQGSVRHLFQAMIRGQLDKEGFEVLQTRVITADHLANGYDRPKTEVDYFATAGAVKPGKRIGEFLITAPGQLEVHYKKMSWPNVYYSNVYHPVSWLRLKGSSTEVTGTGVPLDPSDIILRGHMGLARAAYMLPHNFKTDSTVQSEDNSDAILLAQRYYKTNSLREKPHMATDKPYYYPGETIWLSGQMLYQNPLQADTLSRVLYVDLIGPEKEVLNTAMLPIANGRAAGQLELAASLKPGGYTLRAYTRWMRNFPDDITYQPLPVISSYDKVVNNQAMPEAIPDPDFLLALTADREQFAPREKIKMTVSMTDGDGKPIASNLVVSVTDTMKVVSVPAQLTLAQAYDWALKPPTSFSVQKPTWEIEYGVGFRGQFLNKKGEAEAASVTIVQGEYEDYGMVATDSTGKFWASGLQFTDSATLALAAVDEKGRPYGSVLLEERDVPEVKGRLPGMNLLLRDASSPYELFELPDEQDYMLLEEVVVEEAAIEPMSERDYGYGPGDETFTQEDIEKYPGFGVMAIIKSGMPGFNENGMYRKNYGMARGYMPTPLVIIDGVRYPEPVPPTGESIDFLNTINPGEIKKITVYTYNAAIFGLAGFDGVIMVETTRGERQAAQKPTIFDKDDFSLYTIKGYTPTKEFKAPDYSQPKESHRQPDTRSTIYWNPSLATNKETGKAEFSFYSADSPTVYRIVVEGMTEDNTPVREVRYVTVEK